MLKILVNSMLLSSLKKLRKRKSRTMRKDLEILRPVRMVLEPSTKTSLKEKVKLQMTTGLELSTRTSRKRIRRRQSLLCR